MKAPFNELVKKILRNINAAKQLSDALNNFDQLKNDQEESSSKDKNQIEVEIDGKMYILKEIV